MYGQPHYICAYCARDGFGLPAVNDRYVPYCSETCFQKAQAAARHPTEDRQP